MNKFFQKTKRALIASLVFVFSLTVGFQVSAANVGLIITTPMTDIAGQQNIYYGNAKGSQYGSLLKLQSDTGFNKFVVDLSGNVVAAGDVTGNRLCIGASCQSSWPSATNYWSVNGANIYNNTGTNVGIGTNAPGAKLQVNNGDNSYGTILATANETPFTLYAKTLTTAVNSESFRLGLKYNADEGNGFISFYRGGSTNGGWLTFSTNGSERMRLTNGGYVGIGITGPSDYLHIAGTNDFTRGIKFSETNGNYSSGIRWGSPNSTPSGWGMDFYTPTAAGSNVINMSLRGNGNVGIGTTNPDTRLVVREARSDNHNSGVYTGPGDLLIRNTNITGANQGAFLVFGSSWNPSEGYHAAIKGANDVWANDGAGNLQFYTAAAGAGNQMWERMRINSSGNVGIGVTDATHAGLNIILDKSTANNGADVDLTINTNSGSPIVDWFVQNWGGSYTFNRGSSGGKVQLFGIDNYGNATAAGSLNGGNGYFSGNVGIGTTGPGSKLEVIGNIQIPNNNDIRTKYANGTVRQAILLASYDMWRAFERKDGTGYGITVNSTGDVGIGGDPTAPLTVKGWNNTYGYVMQLNANQSGGTAGNQLNITNGTYSWGMILGSDNPNVATSNYHGPNSAYVINYNNAPLHFGVNNSVQMTIENNGVAVAGNATVSGNLVYSGLQTIVLTSDQNVAPTTGRIEVTGTYTMYLDSGPLPVGSIVTIINPNGSQMPTIACNSGTKSLYTAGVIVQKASNGGWYIIGSMP
ncbi:MAG: hypothetical protein PHE24_05625 [Patescibacteria group bacterium]|nr:hypothetical protein [Patescibacteria group bacterium]